MRLVLCFLLFVSVQAVNAQLEIGWAKSFGTIEADRLGAMLGLSNGNLLVVGVSQSSNVLMYEIGADSEVIWSNSIPFTQGTVSISDVIHAEDGDGFVVVGSLRPTNENPDCLLIRIDALGNKIWSETYGGSGSDSTREIQLAGDNYIMAGASNSDDGDVLDHRGHYDGWIIWINQNGEIIRSKNYGGSEYDDINSLILTSDNNLLFSGSSYSFINHGMESDYWVTMTNLEGDIIWSHSYGGTGNEILPSAIETENGEFVISGWSNSNNYDIAMDNNGKYDIFLLGIDQDGIVKWSKSYGGSETESFDSIIKAGSKSLFIGGETASEDGDIAGENNGTIDYWIIQLDSNNGALKWEGNFGGTGQEVFSDLVLLNDELYLGGYSYSNNGDIVGDNIGETDYWIVKLINIATGTNQNNQKEFRISPNPCIEYLELSTILNVDKISIYNSSGLVVFSEKPLNTRINVTDLAPGMYFIEIHDNMTDTNYVEKFVKN